MQESEQKQLQQVKDQLKLSSFNNISMPWWFKMFKICCDYRRLKKAMQKIKRNRVKLQAIGTDSRFSQIYQKENQKVTFRLIVSPDIQIIISFQGYNQFHHSIKNMYSGFYTGGQPSYILPQYFTAPAYNFGTLLCAPISLEGSALFSFNPLFPYQPSEKIEQEDISIRQAEESCLIPLKRQGMPKESIRVQVGKKKNKSSPKRKYKKITQNDDRNVVSNLLKIFFKNLLDLQLWDDFLRNWIKKQEIQTSPKRFYQWILDFRLNYRNYIKSKELKLILTVQSCKFHQRILRTLLRRFINKEGVCHSLTARRIDRKAVMRHVKGLRQIGMLLDNYQS